MYGLATQNVRSCPAYGGHADPPVLAHNTSRRAVINPGFMKLAAAAAMGQRTSDPLTVYFSLSHKRRGDLLDPHI